MVRTKQTCRKSTGGRAPRRHIATETLWLEGGRRARVPDIQGGDVPCSTLDIADPSGIVTRPLDGGATAGSSAGAGTSTGGTTATGTGSGNGTGTETLVVFRNGTVAPLHGAGARGALGLPRQFMALFKPDGSSCKPESFRSPVWDEYSRSVLMVEGSTGWKGIVQLSVKDGRDTVSRVLALPSDRKPRRSSDSDSGWDSEAQDSDGGHEPLGGPGYESDTSVFGEDAGNNTSWKQRTRAATLLASDGEGRVFYTAGREIKVAHLPASMQAGGGGGGGGGGDNCRAEVCWRVDRLVTGLAFVRPIRGPEGVQDGEGDGGGGGASSSGNGCTGGGSEAYLLFSTRGALYRMRPRAAGGAGPSASSGAGRGQGFEDPELVAGKEGDESRQDGRKGRGTFQVITGLTLDATCRYAYVTDAHVHDDTLVRRVDLSNGRIKTLAKADTGSNDWFERPSVLPSGYMAVLGSGEDIVVIDLGLTPLLPKASSSGPSSGPGQRQAADASQPAAHAASLVSDMRSLLERQPDGTSDLELVVGDRTFHAHRGVLAARCPHVARLLAEAEAEGAAAGADAAQLMSPRRQRLELQGVDPDALPLALRWVYTGSCDEVPSRLQRPLFELAMRLELPGLQTEASTQLVQGLTPATAVPLLLWAAQQAKASTAYTELLEAVKAWFVNHQDEVTAAAPESVKRAMVEETELMFELHAARVKRMKRG
ncbi:hypothetical protein HYH03_010772 [Edaphochlamys debaryana]|uniref:BTB domain-containing protein n=1 Tax=Edaphochlamys debaryana TaxID=47281 RepID=A0A836BX65_9CHLO|nr:hypothetical protein HYH03_010772 [Edaphochlamys debaryana]|eukprot:KAG2490854.1 hypothetical protein HYH03_010772 [Edaphochlamys debaryana]